MASVTVSVECTEKFEQLSKGEHRFIVLKIKNEEEIILSASGARDASFDELKTQLASNACAYAVLNKGLSDLILITWRPECASVKDQMMYSSFLHPVKTELGERVKRFMR